MIWAVYKWYRLHQCLTIATQFTGTFTVMTMAMMKACSFYYRKVGTCEVGVAEGMVDYLKFDLGGQFDDFDAKEESRRVGIFSGVSRDNLPSMAMEVPMLLSTELMLLSGREL